MTDQSPKTPPSIVLLRHGETQWNREGRYQGQHDSPLTLNGIGQIRAIAETLRPVIEELGRCQLWSSPLARTRQSVSIFCEQLGLSYADVLFDDRLMERSYGRWEGLTMGEIAARYPEDVKLEQSDRWNFAIPEGGECFADVARRLRNWLNEIPNDMPVITMAHGGSGRVLRGVCMNLKPENIFAFNDPQSSAFVMSETTTKTVQAAPQYLRAFGCADAGLGVRI
ncbi:histidine phosphatase family protein [Magnetovibrio sp.]|uniref:histidine phosphatase family protein n=1 Tax=Magnetovibrio sp. TaxID=2024836 RepID=UPI002F95CD25